MDTTEETGILGEVYQGLACQVFLNPSSMEERWIREAVAGDSGPVVLLGHGTPYGLLGEDMSSYIVDSSWVDILRDREVIGIWCYASEFADRYGLHGFFTSMFVSNLREAVEHGVDDGCSEEDIFREFGIFCRSINRFLREGIPMCEWVGLLQAECNRELHFVRFNYECLSYYE